MKLSNWYLHLSVDEEESMSKKDRNIYYTLVEKHSIVKNKDERVQVEWIIKQLCTEYFPDKVNNILNNNK